MGILQIVRRAASASPHEWWTRGRQAVFTKRNWLAAKAGSSAFSKHAHLRALGISARDIGAWWKQRRNQWFVNESAVATLASHVSNEESAVPWLMASADAVLDGKLPIFSLGEIHHQGQDRWHRDFIGEKAAPQVFYGNVPYLDPTIVGDHKFTWEPNRFAWAMWLGLAYRVREEQKYADKFKEWTLDWFRSNPYPFGINYCSALEVAYRNYAWLWSLSLFSDYLKAEPELLERLLHGLWIGSRHVEENLSTYFSPNTHITGEAFGLFATGAAIPEFKDATRWRNLGLSILAEETRKQFFQDGMHTELSSGYHIYSTDLCLQAMLIGKESGFRIHREITATGHRAARRLAEIAPHDLVLPQFNDCDGGRLLSLVPESLDAGPTLMAAESLFPNEHFLPSESKQSRRGYPLLMTSAPFESKARRKARTIPIDRDMREMYDSGLATHRTAEGDYLLLRASKFGYMSAPHSHDGGLGVILHLGGTPIFLDNGVGSYIQSEEVRNEFRMAMGKNTILLDGKGPSVPGTAFDWEKTTDSELVSMRLFQDGFTARGKHSGYSDSTNGTVFVQRETIMLDMGIVAIVDRWDANEEIALQPQFTLNPLLTFDAAQNMLNTSGSKVFHMLFASLNAGEEIEIHHNRIRFSPNYGLITEGRAISLMPPKRARGGMVTFLSRCGPLAHPKDDLVVFEDGTVSIQFELSLNGVQVSNREMTSA